jgi:Protein of unknown function (DUF4245)
MTDGSRTSSEVDDPQDGGAPGTPPPVDRAARFNAANMLRSLLPLVVLCLLVVAWTSWRQSGDERVQTVDPASTIQLAAARASYGVLAPSGLPDDYLVTSARTDAGTAEEGDTVTLEIGYLTPAEEFAGFVVSDDPGAGAVVEVVADGVEQGEVRIAGQTWQRLTTPRGETAFVREADGVTVAVTGSASDDELRAVAASVEPYSP